MAGLRYKSHFDSSNGAKYRIAIYDTEFLGDGPGQFCTGPEGFELSYEGNTDDIWKPFVPSRLEFKFNVEDSIDEAFVIDCATGEPNRFKVFVTESSSAGDGTNALFWQGFVQGEGITITDEYYPIEVSLAASDIAFFKDIEYSASGDPITGEKTAIETVLNVLEIAGHNDFYNDGVHTFDEILTSTIDWRGVTMATGGDPMTLTAIDQWTFYGYNSQNSLTFKNCQQVIEEVCKLFGARFFQSKGKFRLSQPDGLIETTQRFYTYDVAGALANSGTVADTFDIDRVDLYEMSGGSTTFAPGIKWVEREYKYRRNYLEGRSADQDTPLSVNLGDIPLLSYIVSSQAPRFTLKFNITYKILDIPDIGTGGPLGLGWIPKNQTTDYLNFVPLWRMNFRGVGETDGYTWHFSQAMAERDPWGFEHSGPSLYNHIVGSKKEWIEERPQYSGWSPVLPRWQRADQYDISELYFEIIDEEDYPIIPAEVDYGTYVPEERTINVELTIPYFGSPSIPQNIDDLLIDFDIHDLYNRYNEQWTRQSVTPIDLADYVEWKIDSFELIVHGDTLEEKPETGRKYRVTSPDGYRKTKELPACELVSLDKRTWHSIRVYTGSIWTDSQFWYRGTDSANFVLLNYLSCREAVAMNRGGLRLYQGSLVDLGQNTPAFHNPLTKGSNRFMMVQGTFSASMDEWRSLTMIQLLRDATSLTYEQLKTDGLPSGGALPSGNYSSNNNSGDAIDTGYRIPDYEFASAVTGSSYTITEFELSEASGLDASGINLNLWVFQDATKLSYPTGYTIDFSTN
jgi:hypothetical protein